MDTDEQQIRKLVARWMDATRTGDSDTVLSLMTDDVVFLVAGQPPMIGKESFAALASGQQRPDPASFEGNSDIQEIHVSGDIAYLWARLTVKITPPGVEKPVTRAGYTLTVLRKQAGQWLLARDANMLVAVDQ